MEPDVTETSQRKLVQGFWLFFFTSSLLTFYVPENISEGITLDIIATILWSVFALLWVRLDSRALGIQVSPLFNIGVFFLSFIFVPAYLIRSRGFLLGALDLGTFLLKLLGATLLLMALWYGLEYLGFLPEQT